MAVHEALSAGEEVAAAIAGAIVAAAAAVGVGTVVVRTAVEGQAGRVLVVERQVAGIVAAAEDMAGEAVQVGVETGEVAAAVVAVAVAEAEEVAAVGVPRRAVLAVAVAAEEAAAAPHSDLLSTPKNILIEIASPSTLRSIILVSMFIPTKCTACFMAGACSCGTTGAGGTWPLRAAETAAGCAACGSADRIIQNSTVALLAANGHD